MLGDWKICRKSIASAKVALNADEKSNLDLVVGGGDEEEEEGESTKQSVGGKRAWKNGSGGEDDARAQSLALFREHKVAEQRHDLQLVEEMLERGHKRELSDKGEKGQEDEEDRGGLLPYFLRVLSFQQGNSVDVGVGEHVEEKDNALAVAALRRFGLDAYVARRCRDGAGPPPISPSRIQAAPVVAVGEEEGRRSIKEQCCGKLAGVHL